MEWKDNKFGGQSTINENVMAKRVGLGVTTMDKASTCGPSRLEREQSQ